MATFESTKQNGAKETTERDQYVTSLSTQVENASVFIYTSTYGNQLQ